MGKVSSQGPKRPNDRKVVKLRKEEARISVRGKKALTAATAKAEQPKNGRPADPPVVPAWVPKEARRAIEALWESDLNKNDRATLIRLATYPAMRGLWTRLPRKPEGLAESVIRGAIFALGIFRTLRDPRSRSRKGALGKRALEKWARFWLMVDNRWSRRQSANELFLETCARLAFRLGNAVNLISDEKWSRHWPGNPAMKNSMSAARFFLDAAKCFQLVNEADRLFESKLRLPPVARWNDPQGFFIDFMCDRLEADCDGPCVDDVVSALTGVAFDRRDGRPGPATVRGRRRLLSGKLGSKI